MVGNALSTINALGQRPVALVLDFRAGSEAWLSCLAAIPELLKAVGADRLVITDRLINLNEEELQRQAYHPKFGYVSIDKWTEFFLLHEAHHLFTIIQLIGALYVTPQ